MASICFICKTLTDEDKQLKRIERTGPSLKNAAFIRSSLMSDKYEEVTRRILSSDFCGEMYHPSCHRRYTAVKRPKDELGPSKRDTRSSSVLPKTERHGILKRECIFCGKERKKKRGKEEPLTSIATKGGCDTLLERAHRSTNDHFKSLIMGNIDLIAKEGKYHKSCRWQFMHETEVAETSCATPHDIHKRAFKSLCGFITEQVIQNEKSLMVTSLLNKYKAEYTSNGGDPQDVDAYTTQNLIRKVQDKFGEQVRVKLADNRRGNFIHAASLTEEQARVHLYDNTKEHEENEKLIWAALHLRSQIMQLPKSKVPDPATVQNLKESAPDIPKQLELFFKSLIGGLTPNLQGPQNGAIDRRATSMASDAVFNATHGTVKPWKHTAMGLGVASLTGSKLTLQILNRAGHSISYCDAKGLETEFAYSVSSGSHDAPDGIHLLPDRATACVWDNNDANVETLDGKATLHSTVGHTYQNTAEQDKGQCSNSSFQFREGKNRRTFVGNEQEIPPLRKSLKAAIFTSTAETVTSQDSGSASSLQLHQRPGLQLKPLDLYWLLQLKKGDTPLYAGFISNFVKDVLPLQRICYMDPIPKSPTDNAVVRETMIRTLNVAKETGQSYAVVTYDLAVALKAYSIQALESPLFDKLLIMLGNFHIELAFYGAIGTMVNESGIEFILTEAEVLAEGSMMGFMKGKFYNRCTRIHELLANVMELKLYDRFVQDLPEEEYQGFQDVMMTIPSDQVEDHLSDSVIMQHLLKYEEFFYSVTEGTIGPMAQFWGTYVFLVNRVHRELQRCVKTNDVDGYIDVFPAILDVFFSLNRPNYARWGTLFLHKLTSSHPQLREILQKGAFSIRRTKKNYSRSAVDLSLEQTVNRDAASSMKGIVAFRNSENARRRWSMTMTQRAMAVLELRTFAGLEVGESATAQCRSYRIRKDNKQMQALSEKIDEFCNPFSPEAPDTMVNLATGRTATKETEKYLLETLQRGQVARQQFEREWHKDSARFLKSVKRIRVNNFASENEKKKKGTTPATESAKRVESVRDFFIRILIVVAENTNFDLKHVLRYPITPYPLSLAHADGALLKSRKHTLLNRLEEFQKDTTIPTEVHQGICVRIYDGGLLIHSVLSVMNVGTSYGAIARTILSTVCTGGGDEIHVCLDKYVENSVKDSERKLRGAEDSVYTITGPNQTMRHKGAKLLKNGIFKNELGKFLLKEWGKNHYWNILNGKTLYASYGGECFQYTPNEFQDISVTSPAHLQANHEEADTLIAFHLEKTSGSMALVRASDTDILIILIGILGNQDPEVRSSKNVFMDCGIGNSRRYINVTNIVEVLEERKAGLPKALPGYHAFTGCDFTSAFYR